MLQRERDKAMRAPMIIVAAAKVNPAAKIPVIEQVVAVAASVQNMIMAATALGYGTMWKTGASAYDDDFKKGLGLEPVDQIVGYIYLGTPMIKTPPRDIRADAYVSYF
jgi:nitroreductase